MSLKPKMQSCGWLLFNDGYKAPFSPVKDIFQTFKRVATDIVALPFFLAALAAVWLFVGKKQNGKILLGTHPIVTFKLLRGVLAQKFDTTLFVFSDWSNGNFHDGVTLKDIAPAFIAKNPYGFGSYWAFIWALSRFELFILYFDGGFLERTIWWRFEPLIFRLFGKKTLLVPYGADVWDSLRNQNLAQKFGHLRSRFGYFGLDKKRIERMYLWSRYADFIVAFADYARFLPRIDCMVYHGHIVEDEALYGYVFNDASSGVNILHYANDPVRKGTAAVEYALLALDGASFQRVHGLPRNEALALLENAHIFVEQVVDGFVSFSCIEAMLRGKVVVTYCDDGLQTFYETLCPDYYVEFFQELPVISCNALTLRKTVEKLLASPENLRQISLKSREFALNLVQKNRLVWQEIVQKLLERA